MTFENRTENAAQPQQGHAAIAQQAWGPQAHTEKPAAQPVDAQQALNNGLALVGNLYNSFVHAAEMGVQAGTDNLKNDSTVKAVVHLANSVANKVEEDAKEEAHNPIKHDLINPALQAVGVARGVFNFECELSDIISHPLESGQKALTPVLGVAAFVVGMNKHFYTLDINGLGNDFQQIESFSRHAVNGVIGAADYAVSASPDQQGELIGHYALPSVVSSLAGAKVMSSLKAFGTVEEVSAAGGAEASLLQNTKSIVGKTLTKSEEFENDMRKGVFGKHHEHVKEWHETISPVAEPTQSSMEGAHKAYENQEIADALSIDPETRSLLLTGIELPQDFHLPTLEISGS